MLQVLHLKDTEKFYLLREKKKRLFLQKHRHNTRSVEVTFTAENKSGVPTLIKVT